MIDLSKRIADLGYDLPGVGGVSYVSTDDVLNPMLEQECTSCTSSCKESCSPGGVST